MLKLFLWLICETSLHQKFYFLAFISVANLIRLWELNQSTPWLILSSCLFHSSLLLLILSSNSTAS
jgi:hypothetical protein